MDKTTEGRGSQPYVRMILRHPQTNEIAHIMEQRLTPKGNMPKSLRDAFVRAIVSGGLVEAKRCK